MSDDNVTDLGAFRQQRGEEAHKRGEAFYFKTLEYDDEWTVGFMPEWDGVVIMTDPETKSGVRLTRDDAWKMLRGLAEAMTSPHAPWNKPKDPT